MRSVLFATLLLCLAAEAQGQVGELPKEKMNQPPRQEEKQAYKGSAIMLHLGFGVQTPGGDLADRFGNNGLLGGGVEYLSQSNWLFGAEGHYLFGSEVKEDPLAILRNEYGQIIGNDRLAAEVYTRERGFYAGALVGKLFPVSEKSRSGIRVTLGAGYMQQWIRVQDDTRTVNQITGDYKKGYDRRCGGLALNQFIGWQQLSTSSNWNFVVGLEFNQGFTQTLRDWDFNDRGRIDESRLDLRFGLRANWTLPWFLKVAEKIYY